MFIHLDTSRQFHKNELFQEYLTAFTVFMANEKMQGQFLDIIQENVNIWVAIFYDD